ncbi:MAG: hypothetical protein RI932_2643, partial [Pseudomonadota bacterium]
MHRRETTPLCCVWIRWAVVAMFASVAVHAQADFEDAPIASEPSPAAAPVQPAAPVNSAPPSQSETPSAPPPTRTGGAGKSS